MTLNLTSIAKRVGAGALAAAATAAVQITATGQLPHTAPEIGLTVLTGLIAASPFGPAPTGLLTPAAPGQAALLPQLLGSVKALVVAPAQKRNAALIAIAEAAGRGAAQAAIAEAVNQTGQFGPGELAQAAPVQSPPVASVPDPAPVTEAAPVAPVVVEAPPVGQ